VKRVGLGCDLLGVARRDAPTIEVRERGDGTWVMFDGHGRTYRFAQISSALAGKNLWLLQDVTGPGGSKVQLDYSIATPTLSGTPTVAIDLTGASYNPHPTAAGCFKHAVVLSYDPPASSPLSVSMLGTVVLARLRKLATVNVTSKEAAEAPAVSGPSATAFAGEAGAGRHLCSLKSSDCASFGVTADRLVQ
jgi:hypothetical protein